MRPVTRSGRPGTIRQPIDFLGVNYYNAERISFDVDGSLLKARSEPYSEPGWGRTTMGWGIAPSGLTTVLLELHRRYPGPAYLITENGCALDDQPDAEGRCDDQGRIAYLRAHLEVAGRRRCDRGIDVGGYFIWTLFDNFEWALGLHEALRSPPGRARNRRIGSPRPAQPGTPRLPVQTAWRSRYRGLVVQAHRGVVRMGVTIG